MVEMAKFDVQPVPAFIELHKTLQRKKKKSSHQKRRCSHLVGLLMRFPTGVRCSCTERVKAEEERVKRESLCYLCRVQKRKKRQVSGFVTEIRLIACYFAGTLFKMKLASPKKNRISDTVR